MHLNQFYHARLDLLSLVIDYVCFVHLSRETYVNHSRGSSKSGLTFDRRRAHLRNLWLLLVSSVSNCMQEPITRSEQLPYKAYVRAYLRISLFLDTF